MWQSLVHWIGDLSFAFLMLVCLNISVLVQKMSDCLCVLFLFFWKKCIYVYNEVCCLGTQETKILLDSRRHGHKSQSTSRIIYDLKNKGFFLFIFFVGVGGYLKVLHPHNENQEGGIRCMCTTCYDRWSCDTARLSLYLERPHSSMKPFSFVLACIAITSFMDKLTDFTETTFMTIYGHIRMPEVIMKIWQGLKAHATLLANNLQQHPTMLWLVASVCMVWPVSNRTQQVTVPTSANIVVFPCKRTQQVTTLLGPRMLGVVGQQCCVRLHGPLTRRGWRSG